MTANELKVCGRILTVLVLLGIYCSGWASTIKYLRTGNDKEFCGVVTTIWIIGHTVGLVWFLVWSWS